MYNIAKVIMHNIKQCDFYTYRIFFNCLDFFFKFDNMYTSEAHVSLARTTPRNITKADDFFEANICILIVL